MELNRLSIPKKSHKSTFYSEIFGKFILSADKINEVIRNCNDVQSKINATNEMLKIKPNFTYKEPENSSFLFSRAPGYQSEKMRLRQNLKAYIENQFSDRLDKLKSIILNDTSPHYRSLSPEDIQNNEAAKFLRLNKREFGTLSPSHDLKYDIPFKLKKNAFKINPIETVLNNIKSIMKPQFKAPGVIKNSDKSLGNLLANVQEHTPRNKFVENELMKLWPSKAEELNRNKKKIMRIKLKSLEKLQKISLST